MIFIDACFRQKTPYTPTWLMRQAGRYLSEYRESRAKVSNFLSLCSSVDLATEITLQPVDILDVDAAILFSDILLVPHHAGLPLEFKKDFGPVFLQTIEKIDDVNALKSEAYKDLGYVYEIVNNVRKKLSKDKALIGFCGAPFTLATYMCEGGGSKSYEKTKKLLYANPQVMHALLSKLSFELKHYLCEQIRAGADCVMIFDSWANALEIGKYLEFSWKYILEITTFIKEKYPKIPIIVFPRGCGAFLESLSGNFEVLGIDWQISMHIARQKVGGKYVLQGNLEPARLYDLESMKEGVRNIIKIMKNNGHIFNLGHGMIKDLPRENAIELVRYVRELSSKY